MGLYDLDFHAWSAEQAELLKRRSANELDWENIAEEIESLGKQQRSEIVSRLIVLLLHLLKHEVQPGRRSRSWLSSIVEQRDQIQRELRGSPSLNAGIEELFAEAYGTARKKAGIETRLGVRAFPVDPPFTLAQALDPDWLPRETDQSSIASNGS